MVLHPTVYADLLRSQMEKHSADCWLVNTGWTGGPYGIGTRMKIGHTRSMVRAALDGSLRESSTERHEIFNLDVPTSCPGVPPSVLNPRNTWGDKTAYDRQAAHLAELFKKNFERFTSSETEVLVGAGPR